MAMNGTCSNQYEVSLHGGLPTSSSATTINHVGQSHHQHHGHHLSGGGGLSSMSFSSPYDLVGAPPPPSMQHQYGGSAGSIVGAGPGCPGGSMGLGGSGGGGGGGNTPSAGFSASAATGSPWYAPSPVSDPRFASKIDSSYNAYFYQVFSSHLFVNST